MCLTVQFKRVCVCVCDFQCSEMTDIFTWDGFHDLDRITHISLKLFGPNCVGSFRSVIFS